jgi:tetratricopeptide (TPR) repeat protein
MKVLINDSFKKFLISQPGEYRNKVRQKFEYLEIGYWDGGLKVKKIKSLTGHKAVFEARLDRANRILFTLGKEGNNDSTPRNSLIYIWGIASHDDVPSKSRSIPSNVPFLHFEPYEEQPMKELSLEELDASYYSQESISQKIADDSAAQKWHFLDEKNWDRIEAYHQDDFDLALHLTPEQQAILTRPLPLLVSGTAGSGKTTLGIYYLLKLPLAKEKKLFITYNYYLKTAAEKLYFSLLNASPLKDEFHHPAFFTFQEYCLAVAAHYHRPFPREHYVDFERFGGIIQGNSLAHRYDAALIWEEIRSIIKGALPQINITILKKAAENIRQSHLSAALLNALQQQFLTFARLQSLEKVNTFVGKYLQTNTLTFAGNIRSFIETQSERVLTVLERTVDLLQKERELTQKKYLSFVDYEALGRKKAPNFQLDRQAIYKIFEWYQERLDSESLWDELDLTREIMNLLSEREADEQRYDLVVCDEVQDLTDVQHDLLFYIVRSPVNLLLSGDTKQIINPSGFRWEELKRHFYDRELKIPDIHYLKLNFRSSGNVVELSNILLELKAALLGTSAEEPKEDWKYKGRPPVVVRHLGEARMVETIRTTGARKTILVRSEQEKETLKKLLETELVFTINEAKGLEFDTVLLWKFGSDIGTADVWKAVLDDTNREVHIARIRHEINLLYVAITRAQRDLLIYDGKEPSFIWGSDPVRDMVYTTDDANYISNIWDVISSPQEWLEQGRYFFERRYFKAAMECFKNAGEEDLHLKASAYDAERRQDFVLAAGGFEKIGEFGKAASYYEKSGHYDKAYALWKKVKDKEGASRCHLKFLEKDERFGELADVYLGNKDYSKGLEMLVKAGRYQKAAEVSLNHLSNKEAAAEYYEKAGIHDQAARLFRQLGNTERAAGLYEKTGDVDQAIRLWKRLKQVDRLVPLYYRKKDYASLLEIYEKGKDFDNAVKILKKCVNEEQLRSEAHECLAKRRYFPALVRFHILNDHRNIAECAFKLKDYPLAARHYDLEGLHYQAATAYEKAGSGKAAFLRCLKSEEDAVQHFRRAKRLAFLMSRSEISKIGRQFKSQKQYAQALACFQSINDFFQEGIVYLDMGQREKALACLEPFYFQKEAMDMVAAYCLQHGLVDFGALLLLNHTELEYRLFDVISWEPHPCRSPLFQLMDIYFEQNARKDEMEKWADVLGYFPFHEEIGNKRLYYLEKCHLYNEYWDALETITEYYPDFMSKLQKEFSSEYEQLKNTVSEIAAIKLFHLGKMDDFNRIVKQLEVTDNNFEIFASSDNYWKAVQVLLKKGNIMMVEAMLRYHEEWEQLAPIMEEHGYLYRAADYYTFAENYAKSASLYQEIGRYSKAGDHYSLAKDYRKALEMYIKWGRNKTKIAQTFEKLEEYQNAAKVWRELGNMKKVEKCMAKVHPDLFNE